MSLIRRSFLLLAVVLTFSPAPARSANAPQASSASLELRATKLYDVLLQKNARHFRVRDDLAPFFVNQDELATFLVLLAKELDDKGIYTNRIKNRKVEVVESDPAYGYAETRSKLEGEWILWFTRSMTRTDKWKFIDGQWYVNPPPLKNLELK